MSREQIMAELQRRGVTPPAAAAPQIASPTQNREAVLAELQRRGVQPPAQTAPPPQEQGFFGRSAEQLRERGATLADIFAADATGAQTRPETIFQTVGTEIGAIGDIIGEGVVSAAKALPEFIKEPVASAANSLLATDEGKAAIEALSTGVEAYEKFKEANPRAARNLEAAFNVGAAFTPVKGVSAAQIAQRGGRAAKESVQRVATQAPVITSDDIGVLASNFYKRAEELGGNLTPQFTNDFIDSVEGLAPQTEAGRILGGEDAFSKVVERVTQLRDQPLTLQAAQEVDELLGDAVDAALDQGRFTKQARKILQIQDTFREGIEKASEGAIIGGKEGFEALKEGRRLWGASRRLEDIERIIARAELTDNPATAIRTGFRNLVTNPKRIRGFKPKEIKMMKKAAKTGIVPEILRVTLGSRLVPIITAGSGGGLGASALATGASIAARGGVERAATREAANISKEIAEDAIRGLTQDMPDNALNRRIAESILKRQQQ